MNSFFYAFYSALHRYKLKTSLFFAKFPWVIVDFLRMFIFWKPTAFVFNVAEWKRPVVRKFLREYNIIYLPVNKDLYEYRFRIVWSFRPVFIVWGRTIPEKMADFLNDYAVPLHHIEDGFLRSIGLGASHTLPYSLCYDRSGLYYDSSKPSDLEIILNNYDFNPNGRLMALARLCIAEMKSSQLSKYNEAHTNIAPYIYGPKIKKRILVVGQVEDDQSLLYGCEKIMSNVELIRLAYQENPDAQIIYKPHPDVLQGLRQEISNVQEVAHLAEILTSSISLVDALYDVDRVYTLTSLAGFEAIMYGVAVTTVGAPFYSGWGLTDDRQLVERRSRKLSFEEIFAAAYILYPRYINVANRRKSTLPKVIAQLQEQLNDIEIITPNKALHRLRPYNFATKHSVDPRFLYKSTTEEIAIISDSPDSLKVARGMVAQGKRVTLMTARDALANEEVMLLAPEERELIKVTSVHKRYSVPLSETEVNTVKLVQTFGDSLRLALTEVTSQHFNTEVIDALCLGLEDFIYFEALRFYAADSCLNEFDKVILLLNDSELHKDLSKAFLFHGKASKKLGGIYIYLASRLTKDYVNSLAEPKIIDFANINIAKLRSDFSSFWWSLQDEKFNDYASMGKHVAICGSVGADNYAYSPASLELINAVDRNSRHSMLFFTTSLIPVSSQDEIKLVTLDSHLSERCSVYNGHMAKYRHKYPSELMSHSSIFENELFTRFIDLASQRLPAEFIDIFLPRLKKYCDSLFAQTFLIAEANRTMSKALLFATAMDRTHISRVLSALAKSHRVPSIGIQPQIISASTRYKNHVVDHMGVIDTSQVDVYMRLGADKKSLKSVGSANVIARLQSMDKAVCEYAKAPDRKSLLFIMQHSTSHEMIETALALRTICQKHDFSLIVKPHPHQELPILNEVRGIFANSRNVDVLSRDSDTYEAVARCSIIVGLFSSVLLESALYGKDVVVAAFRDIEESIDFSRLGVAIKVLCENTLESTLIDLVEQGETSVHLRAGREAYLRDNPQFLAPYTTATLEQFIAQHLPH